MKTKHALTHARVTVPLVAGICTVLFTGCNVTTNKTVEVSWTPGGTVTPTFDDANEMSCKRNPTSGGCIAFALPLQRTNMTRQFEAQADANFVFEGWSGDCTLWDLNDSSNTCTAAGGSDEKKIKANFRPVNFTGNYTKIDATGNALPADATEWACVLDNNSGLMWEAKTSDGGPHDASWTFSWYSATFKSDLLEEQQAVGIQNGGTCTTGGNCDTAGFVRTTRSAKLCGGNNWRVPTLHELNTLVIPSLASSTPVVDAAFFPDAAAGATYWSSQFRIDADVKVMATMRHDTGASGFNAIEGGSAVPHALRLVRTY